MPLPRQFITALAIDLGLCGKEIPIGGLATGRILFIAVDQGSPSAEAAITAGEFEALVPPGKKRVEIRAPKVTGKKKMYDTPDSPTVDTVVELLPAKYNVNSELKMTVDGTAQEQKFDLQSK